MAGWSNSVSVIRGALWRLFWGWGRGTDAGGDEHYGADGHSPDEWFEELFRRMYQWRRGVLLYLGSDGLLAVCRHHGDGGDCRRVWWGWARAANRASGGEADCDCYWIRDGDVVVCE